MRRKWLPMLLVLAVNVCQGANTPAIIASLQEQWRKSGVASVNARLVARWDHEMVPLLHQASTCHSQALSLVFRLRDTTNATTHQAYASTLQKAMLTCPATILEAMPEEVLAEVCDLGDTADSFPGTLPEDLLRAQIARLGALHRAALQSKVKHCIALYQAALPAG